MRLTQSEKHIFRKLSDGSYKPDPAAAYSSKHLVDDLVRMRRAWNAYQANRDRFAVYIYLKRVYATVRKWLKLRPNGFWATTALFLQPEGHPEITDPFSVGIYCSADPKIVDRKMRSKWSRVLSYAAQKNVQPQKLMSFIQARGGINRCARLYAKSS
jgi:hypothetical protein